jgi:uncharacterized membrane protein
VTTVQQTIDVDVPLRTAYDQWTQFETFPKFMEGVEQVKQLSDRRTHWVTRIGGVTREFDAEIIQQEPDRQIAWQALDGPDQRGVVVFQPIGSDHTRLMLQMDFAPEGLAEQVGDKLGLVERRVRGDLERFKQFIENRGTETGAWRGNIPEDTDLGAASGRTDQPSAYPPPATGPVTDRETDPASDRPITGRPSDLI